MRSTTGHTFGAYASAPWAFAGGNPRRVCGNYTNAAGCFLFLVENPHNDAPTCFDCTNSAMYCHPNNGPTFGAGHDIAIFPGEGAQSYTNFPNSYADTLGRGNATFTGARNFTPEDYEVWAVN